MSDAIKIEYDFKNVKRVNAMVDQIERDGGNVEKPLKRFAVFMTGQVAKTFKEEGRGHVQWKKLSPITVIMRSYKGGKQRKTKRQPKILQKTRNLVRSLRFDVQKKGSSFVYRQFLKAPYAGTHQYGGTMKIPKRVIEPRKPLKIMKSGKNKGKRKGGVLAFEVNGQMVFVRRVVQPARTAKVPKRQMLFFLKTDIDKAAELVEEHAVEAAHNAALKMERKAGRG